MANFGSGLDPEHVFVTPQIGVPAVGMMRIVSGMETHLGIVQQWSGGGGGATVALIGDTTSASGEFYAYPNHLYVRTPVASGYNWPTNDSDVVFGDLTRRTSAPAVSGVQIRGGLPFSF